MIFIMPTFAFTGKPSSEQVISPSAPLRITQSEMLPVDSAVWILERLSDRILAFWSDMKKILYFVPSVIYYLLIFLLSSRDLGIRINRYGLDKVAHAAEFGLFAFLLAIGFFNVLRVSVRVKTAAVLMSGLVLAGLDEFHQVFVHGRVADVRDWLADGIGLAGGVLVFRYLLKRLNRTERKPDSV
jgi:hypothetical protein